MEKVEEEVVPDQIVEPKQEEELDMSEFTCGLCYNPLTAPCKLPCGHFFDTKCIQKHFDRTQEKKWVGRGKGNMGYDNSYLQIKKCPYCSKHLEQDFKPTIDSDMAQMVSKYNLKFRMAMLKEMKESGDIKDIDFEIGCVPVEDQVQAIPVKNMQF